MSDTWRKICAIAAIPRLGTRVVTAPAGAIVLIRTDQDRVYALDDRCPHKGGPLSQGIVCADHVTCPLHAWSIKLADGCASAPDEGRVHVYQTRVENEEVWVRL